MLNLQTDCKKSTAQAILKECHRTAKQLFLHEYVPVCRSTSRFNCYFQETWTFRGSDGMAAVNIGPIGVIRHMWSHATGSCEASRIVRTVKEASTVNHVQRLGMCSNPPVALRKRRCLETSSIKQLQRKLRHSAVIRQSDRCMWVEPLWLRLQDNLSWCACKPNLSQYAASAQLMLLSCAM